MFNNGLRIQLLEDESQPSTPDSMPRLTLTSNDEKAKTRLFTKADYEVGESQNSPPLITDILGKYK